MSRLDASTILLGFTAAILLASGCGAPSKSAQEVEHLFQGSATSLQSKVSDLCESLAQRTVPPTLSGLDLDIGSCSDAGLAALNYSELTSFQFLGIEGDIPEKEKEKVIRKTVRSQVWLNKTLLGFASALSSKFTNTNNQAGPIDFPDSGKDISGLVKTEISQLEPFVFDKDKFELSALIRLKTSESITDLDSEIRISGKMIDESFAVTVQTTSDRKLEQSLIKSLSGVILIVPHASDIYMDIFMDLQVHNIGLAGLFREVIAGILADNLKKISDTLLTL